MQIIVNLPVKLTRMKVRGAMGGPTSLLATVSAPCGGAMGPWAKAPWSWGVDLCPWLNSTGTMPMGGLAQGPMAPFGEMQPRGGPWPPGREINGYPFTTFTDFSDFLGIIPRVYVRILVRLAPILPILTSQ